MTMWLLNAIKSILNTILLYVCAFFSLMGPGTLIWKLFQNQKGKISLLNRDLICDSETLLKLPKSSKPLDEFTNALCPFIPTFLLDNSFIWKLRREVFSHGNNLINERIFHINFDIKLETKQGNILWDVFQITSCLAFQLIFNRNPTDEELNDIYPGLMDINQIIKRFISKPNIKTREKFYQRILLLIKENDQEFLFHNCETFFKLDEIHQVSSVAEDFLTTIAVQCSDLVCHMLILYSQYEYEFHFDIENSINETLRLYPLTDLWTRKSDQNQRGWIASLVQLNRNGWNQPDLFSIERWNEINHPPLMSWGFDIRRCPAQKIATNISKFIFSNIIKHEGFWIQPAANFQHERTFPYGCQVTIGYGEKPTHIQQWKFNNKLKMQVRRWLFEKLRMIDQNELN